MLPSIQRALIKQPITYLEKFGLGLRVQNFLEHENIRTIEHVLCFTENELLELPGFEKASLNELKVSLMNAGLAKEKKLSKVQSIALKGTVKMELFNDEAYTESSDKLLDVIKKLKGSVRFGMTPEGDIHPQSLISFLMGLKEDELAENYQIAVLSAAVKGLIDALSDKQKKKVLDTFLIDMEEKIQHLSELQKDKVEKDRKPKLVMPGPGKIGGK